MKALEFAAKLWTIGFFAGCAAVVVAVTLGLWVVIRDWLDSNRTPDPHSYPDPVRVRRDEHLLIGGQLLAEMHDDLRTFGVCACRVVRDGMEPPRITRIEPRELRLVPPRRPAERFNYEDVH